MCDGTVDCGFVKALLGYEVAGEPVGHLEKIFLAGKAVAVHLAALAEAVEVEGVRYDIHGICMVEHYGHPKIVLVGVVFCEIELMAQKKLPAVNPQHYTYKSEVAGEKGVFVVVVHAAGIVLFVEYVGRAVFPGCFDITLATKTENIESSIEN